MARPTREEFIVQVKAKWPDVKVVTDGRNLHVIGTRVVATDVAVEALFKRLRAQIEQRDDTWFVVSIQGFPRSKRG